MPTTFGIFFLLLGTILLIAGLARGVFARSTATPTWKTSIYLGASGITLILLSFVLMHAGEGQGMGWVSMGISTIFCGILILIIGLWFALWGPFSPRKTAAGWKLIMLGGGLIVLGIIMMTFFPVVFENASFIRFRRHRPNPDLGYIFSRNIGPIPFGVFCLVTLLALNGLGLRKGIPPRKLMGANVFVIAFLILLYALGPTIFSNW